MKLIPLTKGKVAMVDDEDFDELNEFRWHAARSARDNTWYARRTVWPTGRGYSKTIRMHSAITGYAMTDHVDGNGLNNQRRNLRAVTPMQNAMNRCATRGRRKGVTRVVGRSAWRARIGAEGKRIALGYFKTEEEAARAYDAAARELYGPYAALNYPGPGERSAVTGRLAPPC